MKTLLIILLIQHAVISARAGLVTYVNSMTVLVYDHMGEGKEIRSRLGSRFEAMLGPDSYVRTRNRAAIVLESEALDNTVLRLARGSAIVEAKKIDDDIPIRILVGDLEFSIREDGLYLFEENRITVLEGELGVDDSGGQSPTTRLRKDHRLVRSDGDGIFREERFDDTAGIASTPLVRWSRQRSERLTPDPVLIRSRGRERRFRF
jgi:hypothetical protein